MCQGASNVISIEHHDISVHAFLSSIHLCTSVFVSDRNKLQHRDVKSLSQYHTTKTWQVIRLQCLVYPRVITPTTKTRASQTLMLSQITEDLVIVQI